MAATGTIVPRETATLGELRGALEVANNRAESWQHAAEANHRELTAARDALTDLRRRMAGALHRIRTFDCTGGAGLTAGLLVDLKLILETSRDGEVRT